MAIKDHRTLSHAYHYRPAGWHWSLKIEDLMSVRLHRPCKASGNVLEDGSSSCICIMMRLAGEFKVLRVLLDSVQGAGRPMSEITYIFVMLINLSNYLVGQPLHVASLF